MQNLQAPLLKIYTLANVCITHAQLCRSQIPCGVPAYRYNHLAAVHLPLHLIDNDNRPAIGRGGDYSCRLLPACREPVHPRFLSATACPPVPLCNRGWQHAFQLPWSYPALPPLRLFHLLYVRLDWCICWTLDRTRPAHSILGGTRPSCNCCRYCLQGRQGRGGMRGDLQPLWDVLYAVAGIRAARPRRFRILLCVLP